MNATRTVLMIVLLLFVGATVGTLIAQEVSRPETPPIVGNDTEPAGESAGIAAGVPSMDDVVPPIDVPAQSDEGEPAEPGIPSDPELTQAVAASPEPASLAVDLPCIIEATYFHNTNRCVTCLKIEGDAKAIVEAEFADQIATGKLRWVTINMEDERAYISQYNLVSPSLVLIRKVADQVVDWVTLEETWALVRSSTRYSDYIISSFEAFLGECP